MLIAQEIIEQALKKLRDSKMVSLDTEKDYTGCCDEASRRLALALKTNHKRHRAQLIDGKPDYELPKDFIAMYGSHIWFEDRNEDTHYEAVRKRVCEVSYNEVKDKADLEYRIGTPKIFWFNNGSINLYPAPSVEQEEFTYRGKDNGLIIDGLTLYYRGRDGERIIDDESFPVVYRSRHSDDRDFQEIYFDYYNYEPVVDMESELNLPEVLRLPMVCLTASVICEENEDPEGQIKMLNLYSVALHKAAVRAGTAVHESTVTGMGFFGG
jgi:hypothetical protein